MDLVTLLFTCVIGTQEPSACPEPSPVFRDSVEIADADPIPPRSSEGPSNPAPALDRWQSFIAEASSRFGIPEPWIRAVMAAESGGQIMLGGRPIKSSAGAMGLMQLMPETYTEMRRRHGLGADPYEPRDNILAGVAYLRLLYERYGYPRLFAAYNAGPARLDDYLQHGVSLPEETRRYLAMLSLDLRDAVAPEPVVSTLPDQGDAPVGAMGTTGTNVLFPLATASTVASRGPDSVTGKDVFPSGSAPNTPASGGLFVRLSSPSHSVGDPP
ncbi:MAG: lytic transglycosylase domain-containing protein [Aliidongia sp.]